MYSQHAVSIEQLLADSIIKHVIAVSNQSRIFLNLFTDLSQYHWRNSVMDTLVATGLETIDVWHATRRVPKESLVQEVTHVICDIQSMVSAKRSHSIMNSLTHEENRAFQEIQIIATRLNDEIESYFNPNAAPASAGYRSPYGQSPSHSTKPINPRYAKAKSSPYDTSPPTQQPDAPITSARYRSGSSTKTATTPDPIAPKGRQYVIANKGTNKMSDSETLVYETHRRATFSARPADRSVEPDFMGALARNTVVMAGEKDNDVNAFDITKLATDVVATCREHAQAIYSALITDAGNVLSPDAVLEYSYDEVRAIRTMADEESLRLALLNDARIVQLRENTTDLSELAKVIGELIADPNSHLANAIGRQLNLTATEQINRLISFDLDKDWVITDFQASYAELLDALYEEHGKEVIDDAIANVSEDIITKIGLVFTPTLDSDADLCASIDAIHQREIATRSVFTLRQVHVTHIPANFANLNLTFEGKVCLVDPSDAPELYSALVSLEERMEGGMRKFSRILLVTEDEVEMEVIPTYLDLKDGSDNKQYAIKLIRM